MNKLKYLRLKNNLKQSNICELLHINQPNYSNYENGKISLNITYAKILSTFYKVSLSYLLNDSEDEIYITKEEFEKLKVARDIIDKLDSK